ncbi:hypothetical protein HAX54_006631 [Datura stramonium]|uniref:Uncharacterized protein n=1 Tax=Datura stramonium TaxID=4076 RepID=A0ABS8WU61_DATST|nr:hypothetical protein [Datura stramonium]
MGTPPSGKKETERTKEMNTKGEKSKRQEDKITIKEPVQNDRGRKKQFNKKDHRNKKRGQSEPSKAVFKPTSAIFGIDRPLHTNATVVKGNHTEINNVNNKERLDKLSKRKQPGEREQGNKEIQHNKEHEMDKQDSVITKQVEVPSTRKDYNGKRDQIETKEPVESHDDAPLWKEAKGRKQKKTTNNQNKKQE